MDPIGNWVPAPGFVVMMFRYDPPSDPSGWLLTGGSMAWQTNTAVLVFGDPHKDRQVKVKPT